MKLNIITLVFLTFLFSMVLSCASDNSNKIEDEDDTIMYRVDIENQDLLESETLEEKDSESIEEVKIEIIASKYICPQGDKEGNSDNLGICPVCEMELIENPDFNSNK